MDDWTAPVRNYFADRWTAVREAIFPPLSSVEDEQVAAQARAAAPIVWLIGKVQSGKTSIIRALTQVGDAEIGDGFRACTRTARLFEFPQDAPVMRFLDTRGLGEVRYDPAEDVAFSEAQAHLLLVVMKAMDTQQQAVADVVRQVRGRHPEWPVVLAQTSLHDAYRPGSDHPDPYPFGDDGAPNDTANLPADLVRSLAWQQSLIGNVPGDGPVAFVPLDFTKRDDGFACQYFGFDALLGALDRVAPAGLAAALRILQEDAGGRRRRQAHPHILGYATAAAAADILPGAGIVAVPGVQAKMLHSLAQIYGVTWDRSMAGEFAGALGTGTVIGLASSFGVRQLAKFIPVYGQTAGAAAAAAASFATTFAIGKAACVFLGRRQISAQDREAVLTAYREAFASAVRMARERNLGAAAKPAA